MGTTNSTVTLPIFCWLVWFGCTGGIGQEEFQKRQPWTLSKIFGSPDEPLPLSLVPAFPKLLFNDPMHLRWQSTTGRYFVCELGAKIWSFPHEEAIDQADLAADFKNDLKSFDPARFHGCKEVYSMAFDPDFASNRYLYVCLIFANKNGKPEPDGTRVSRFHVTDKNPPTIDLTSELPILSWVDGGHNGCDLAFDNSGCLLISTGDATDPSPPDRLKTGQDCSDLLASVLRVDVRGATKEKPYSIPQDNPFLSVPNVREEIWAFGFRNPWRIAVDTVSGKLLVGDVGWEKWELVHDVVKGGNYGWSIREGHELIQPNEPVGPSPILPPRLAISHADSASITGGFVYRGKSLDLIHGQYLFGDWISGRIWALPLSETSNHKEVASGQLRIIAFSPDRDGEPLVLNHLNKTSLFRLVKNENFSEQQKLTREFPTRLSQTGLFANVATQTPNQGVQPFPINFPMWHDGATSSHFLALPNQEKVTVYNSPQPVGSVAMFNSRLHYPPGTVLAKTLRFEDRNIETQVLHYDGRLWKGYSYAWNENQTDAELVPAEGAEIKWAGTSPRHWRIPSRTECMQCHNPWPETTLAFTPEQLHRPELGDKSPWIQLVRGGYVETWNAGKEPIAPESCVRRALSHSTNASVEHRARSYLHVNCSHCHQFGAGAAVSLSLMINDDLSGLKAVDVLPSKGTFGIPDASLIAAGKPSRSSLLFRMASSSTGRMPHIGSREVDFQGVTLIRDWIQSLDSNGQIHASLDIKENLLELVRVQQSSPEKQSSDQRSSGDSIEKAFQVALQLAKEMGRNESMTPHLSDVRKLSQANDSVVASLFEGFLPVTERQRRLGRHATYADIADLKGDPQKGESWFFDTNRSQCSKCHKVGERGANLGPELTRIGVRLTPSQLFESLHEPSRVIDPKYQTYLIQMEDGTTITGVMISETTEEIVLLTSTGEKRTALVAEITNQKRSRESIMPSGITNEMTAQQVADLIAYISGLGKSQKPE